MGITGLVGVLCALAASTEPVPAARALFLGTVVVEILALVSAIRARAGFDPDDPGRRHWTLIAAFLATRVLAELRLASIYFDLIPESITSTTIYDIIYVKILLWLYTVSDLLFVGAVVMTLRATRNLGMNLRLQTRDYVLIATIVPFPAIAFMLQDPLKVAQIGTNEAALLVYRLVAVSLGTVIAGLCVALYGLVRQMGGGVLARVWGSVALAGIARAASFVVFAVVGLYAPPVSELLEQVLLWVFACAWYTATREQEHLAEAAARIELD